MLSILEDFACNFDVVCDKVIKEVMKKVLYPEHKNAE
jgi:hypothetical protein